MKRTTDHKFQLESLRKTDRTKQQILEKIQAASPNELKALVPSIEDLDKQDIVENAQKILEADSVPQFTDIATESIILAIGRPAFIVKNSLPILSGNEVEKWQHLVNNAISNHSLAGSIKSVGRIELDNHPQYTWVGTGWLIEEDIIITNRHVAEVFSEKSRTSYRFKSFGNSVLPRIDFLAEYKNPDAAEFELIECIYISPEEHLDVAMFRIRMNSGDFVPLRITDSFPREREDIALIGYPALDSRVTRVEDMERIFGNIYDVKRFAPGKVFNIQNNGVALHDATSTGGASGASLISLETGKVVALHFAGREGIANYCITAPFLKSIVNKLPKRTLHPVNPSPFIDSSTSSILPELVGRQCHLEEYTKVKIPSFKISGRMIAYASPDSTYYVTKKFFQKATESILIGIYDLSAEHMVVCIKEALDRGVKVALMLDIDSEKERLIFKKLKRWGVECVPAPSCASENVSYFSSSHEKVVVIDNKWTLIQSGNYSDNSIPYNEGDGDASVGFRTGNRDMGIAIESAPLARFFTRILRSDMKLEETAAAEESITAEMPYGEMLIEAPRRMPDPLFPSKEFNWEQEVLVQPVLTPDNYLDIVRPWLKTAKKSIKIEQQYIRVDQKEIKSLLKAIPQDIDVKIIVAPPIKDAEKTQHEVETLQTEYNFDVRLLSKRHFAHCHNKLIIIDDKEVLISSQNWSDSAVVKNREAGVIIYHKDVAGYYSKIFNADWTMSDEPIEEAMRFGATENMDLYTGIPGKYIRMDIGDIQEL